MDVTASDRNSSNRRHHDQTVVTPVVTWDQVLEWTRPLHDGNAACVKTTTTVDSASQEATPIYSLQSLVRIHSCLLRAVFAAASSHSSTTVRTCTTPLPVEKAEAANTFLATTTTTANGTPGTADTTSNAHTEVDISTLIQYIHNVVCNNHCPQTLAVPFLLYRNPSQLDARRHLLLIQYALVAATTTQTTTTTGVSFCATESALHPIPQLSLAQRLRLFSSLVVQPLYSRHLNSSNVVEASFTITTLWDNDAFLDAVLQALLGPFSTDTSLDTTSTTHSEEQALVDVVWDAEYESLLADTASVLLRTLQGIASSLTTTTTSAVAATMAQWKNACRLLVRLTQWHNYHYSLVPPAMLGNVDEASYAIAYSTNETVLLDGLTSALQIGLACATQHTNHNDSMDRVGEILRPLIQDVWPLLESGLTSWSFRSGSNGPDSESITEHQSTMPCFAIRMWNRLWHAVWQSNPPHHVPNNDRHAPLTAITSILCSILPPLLKLRIPLYQECPVDLMVPSNDSTALVSPWQTSALWDLIHSCLRQGLVDNQPTFHKCGHLQTNARNGSATTTTSESRHWHKLHRRRGLYLLRLLVQDAQSTLNQASRPEPGKLLDWTKYVACFEAVEMETEPHLIDQVWGTVTELFASLPTDGAVTATEEESVSNALAQDGRLSLSLPFSPLRLSWAWMELLLGRIVASPESPVLRKLSLYRLLMGHAGIRITHEYNGKDSARGLDAATLPTPGAPSSRSKRSTKQNQIGQTETPRGAPLSVMTVDFLFTVVVPSFNTLVTSMGTTMQGSAATMAGISSTTASKGAESNNGTTGNKVAVARDMVQLLHDFVREFVGQLIYRSSLQGSSNDHSNPDAKQQLQDFFSHLWSASIVDVIHDKITVKIFQAVEAALEQQKLARCIPIRDDMLLTASESFQLAFSDGSVIPAYRRAMLRSLATVLSCSQPIGRYTPLAVLSVLSLYPVRLLDQPTREQHEMSTTSAENDNVNPPLASWIDDDPALVSLRTWLTITVSAFFTGTNNAGATIATAYVDGMLPPSAKLVDWDPATGPTLLERKMARAVVLFCVLPSSATVASTAGEYLWPAIHKGLVHAQFSPGLSWTKADRVARALLLLESGVKLGVLSGMGNGDLVVDKKTQQMLPPPPNIETMLSNGISFNLHRLRSLVEKKDSEKLNESDCDPSLLGGRSSEARLFCSSYSRLVAQMEALSRGFMSSLAIPGTIGPVMDENIELVLNQAMNSGGHNTSGMHVAFIFAALSCGADVDKAKELPLLNAMLQLQFDETMQRHRNLQASRSIFQCAKWGSLSLLLPRRLEAESGVDSDSARFVARIFDQATDVVESTPSNALVPLFTCVMAAAKHSLVTMHGLEAKSLARLISALFDLLEGCDNGSETMYMMDAICALIFQPALLNDEYNALKENPDCETPIRDAFRRFVSMAGTQRPHIYKVVLSRICGSWLAGDVAGMTAIPYRDDIVNLLVHKEEVVPLASAFTEKRSASQTELPFDMVETSLARGFLLVFLSRLPEQSDGLSPLVHENLLCYTIERLMEMVARPPVNGSGLIMLGTTEYCIKMRSLQALCVLSRYITADIAEIVCLGCIQAMGRQNAHNQLRYFVEIFTLRFARMHPAIFARALVEQLSRTDLSLQMIASLMIITGNLIVGRYEKDFFTQYDGAQFVSLHSILAGVIPWLASTQGFTRAIAQLLVHKLIPSALDVSVKAEGEDDSYHLRSIYRFLDENPEMRRLRSKQSKFFERYEVDSVCTPEGVLSIPVDESHEANPVHLVDVIKECLQQVFEEANVDRAPIWRQCQVQRARENEVSSNTAYLNGSTGNANDQDDELEGIVNFQRKIIPLDALNLAIEGLQEQRLRNIVGRLKQNLIVCASLIDKIPNLGGLARTSEIFAARQLVVPDLQVAKMDNFNSLSVGAGEWIDIVECREQNLLEWLRQRKQEGYYIVGLEQTSSSVSLANFSFPVSFNASIAGKGHASRRLPLQPTILLLGKEKEGIPVEFLQAVDHCIEIPQFGLIRSLNVHVSAAIAIWEFTKQGLLL